MNGIDGAVMVGVITCSGSDKGKRPAFLNPVFRCCGWRDSSHNLNIRPAKVGMRSVNR